MLHSNLNSPLTPSPILSTPLASGGLDFKANLSRNDFKPVVGTFKNLFQQFRCRVIALWKEEGAASVEIELPPERHAALLSISIKASVDWSADGRNREAAIPSLTGVRFLAWGK